MFNWSWRPISFMRKCAEVYGDVFTVRFTGVEPMVFFSDPATLKQIFRGDPERLRAGEANAVVFRPLGPNSLLLLDGDRHRRERKLLMPSFHGERMRLYGDVMCEIADRSIDVWPVGEPFSIRERMQAVMMDIILRTVFGLEEGALRPRLHALVTEYLRLVGRNPPLGLLLAWPRITRLGRVIDRILYDEIARRRAALEKDRTDIMGMLLAARYEDGRPMNDEEIRDEMITMVVAGHETTATALAWVIYHLLQNPDVLATAQAEVVSVIGDGPHAPRPTAKQIAELRYLDAVIKETARLNPVVPITVRRLNADTRIGDYNLPAGSIATPCIYLTHRRPDLWPRPDVFNPNRFLGRRVDPYAFFPFGGGVRHCLGAAFATYEMKIVLARVLARVTLRPDPRYTMRVVRRGITFAPSGGMPVICAGG